MGVSMLNLFKKKHKMENIKLFGLLLLVGVSIWLLLSVLYMLFYSIAAFFYKSKTKVVSNYYPRIAVLIPAYKEDVVTKKRLTYKIKIKI